MMKVRKELRRMNDRLERLEMAVDTILAYIEDLKADADFDTERYDDAVTKLEDAVPAVEPEPEAPVEETAETF